MILMAMVVMMMMGMMMMMMVMMMMLEVIQGVTDCFISSQLGGKPRYGLAARKANSFLIIKCTSCEQQSVKMTYDTRL